MPATPERPPRPDAHAVQPASPTLTNPDMILPDYYDDASSSYSPERSKSPLDLWNSTNNFGLQLPGASAAPITPIIYGNGTMLSDIGEVTEVESVCGRPPSKSYTQHKTTPTNGAGTISYQRMRKKETRSARQRSSSLDSNSTITGGEESGAHIGDFDDTISVVDSNFQGDDEDDDDDESVAGSYIQDRVADDGTQRGFLLGSEDANMDERYSTALSRRAEQILANAKKRLTTMEGNLYRARSSLSSPSLSSVDSDRTPSPHYVNQRLMKQPPQISGRSPFGHARILSENNVPTEPKINANMPRSSSALGAAGGYRKSPQRHIDAAFDGDTHDDSDYSTEGKEQPAANPIYNNPSFSKSKPILGPLPEDNPSPPSPRESIYSQDSVQYLRPESAFSQADQTVRRSASASQMRDIKDQMNDLKGRLSSLRDQAKADSMRRRSLQSLRTPSPFTHAPVEQWYSQPRSATQTTEALVEPRKAPNGVPAAERSNPTSPARPEIVVEEEAENADDSMYGFVDVVDDDDELIPYQAPSIDGEEYTEDEFVDARSESEASMYHDSMQNQLSHEDREDAFDYEHFFLHSAMGSMTRKRMERRDSLVSYSSEESVETTRGPETQAAFEKTHLRHRRGSHGSGSTVASFATATEGRDTRLQMEEGLSSGGEEQDSDVTDQFAHWTATQAKRATFGGAYSDITGTDQQARPPSAVAALKSKYSHRPSVSSMSSVGTNRSFPLVNKPKVNEGVLTPRESPDSEPRKRSNTLGSETSSIYDLESMAGDNTAAAMTALSKDDQILVQRLVASLGKCVLGLTESGRASAESRLARKRIEHAKRILEGLSD